MYKVFFILPSLDCGGADRVTVTFAKKLLKSSYEPTIINLGNEEGELKESIISSLPLKSLGKTRVICSFFALIQLFYNEKPNFVFSSRSHVSVLILFIGIFLRKVKVIIRVPTMPSNILYKTIKSKFIRFLEIQMYKYAYKIIAQTQEMKEEIVDFYSITPKKITVIINPIDEELIKQKLMDSINPFTNNSINYVAIGNISYAKGYDTLIKAFKLLLLKNKNVHLYIIGNCDNLYAKKLISEFITDELIKNIHFIGFSSNPYVYLKYCNSYVLASRMEGLPNAFLEAVYLNKPTIATACIPFLNRVIINEINGILVEVDNIEQMYNGLNKVLDIKFSNINLDEKAIDFKQFLVECI